MCGLDYSSFHADAVSLCLKLFPNSFIFKLLNYLNYLKNDKQYDNALNSIALKTSNLIEKTFDMAMNSLFKGINKAISK